MYCFKRVFFSPSPREERRLRILPRELESDRGRKKRKEI